MSIWQAIWNSTPGGGGGGGGAVDSVNSQTGVVVLDTDDISEGLVNKYYSATQARSDVIASSIVNGDLTHSPDGNSVFDALALKQDLDDQLTSLSGLSYTGNALKVIRVNAGETGFELAFGAGDVTSASNVGTAGVGLFKQKTVTDLEFKKINAGSNKVTITDDTGNDEVDIDINQANIDHGSIAGLGDDDHTQYHNDSRALTWLGTRSTSDLPQGTNLYFTDAAARAASVSDEAYDATTWNGITDISPSKNSLRDKFESLGSNYATVSLNNLKTYTTINAANLFFDTANTPRNFGGVPVTANAGPALSIVGYGTTPASGFNGGPIAIYTDTADRNTGNIQIYTSNASGGKAGDITLTAGTSGLDIMSVQQDYGNLGLYVSNFEPDNYKSGKIYLGEGILNRYVNNDPSLSTVVSPTTYFYNNFSVNVNATADYSNVYTVAFQNSVNFAGTGPIVHSGTNGTHTAFQNSIYFSAQNTLQYVSLESSNVNVQNNSSIANLNVSNFYSTVDSGSNCTSVNGITFNHTTATGGTTQNAGLFYGSYNGPCDNQLNSVNINIGSGFVGDYINGVTINIQDGATLNHSVTGFSFNPGNLSGGATDQGVTGLIFYYNNLDAGITNIQSINSDSARASMTHNGPIQQYRPMSMGPTDFVGTNNYSTVIDSTGSAITAGFTIQTNLDVSYIGADNWTGSAIPGIPPLVAFHGGANQMGQGNLLGAVGLAFTAGIEDYDNGGGPIPTNGNLTDAVAILVGCSNNSTGTGVITNAYGLRVFDLNATTLKVGIDVDVAGSTNIFHEIQVKSASSVRFFDSDSSNFVGLKAPATVSSDVTFTLPSSDGTAGQVLKTDGSGNLSFVTVSAGGANVENFTLSNTDITNGYVTLSSTPADPTKVALLVDSGPSQVYSVDWTVIGSTIDWNGLGLDGIFEAGDYITVIY